MTADSRQRTRIHVTRSRANPGGATGIVGRPFRERKPPWLKVPAPGGPTYRRLKQAIDADNLHTVCEEANCPNVGECWERGTATFMILGDVCTRRCGFCNVQTGVPTWNDPLEPLRVANQVKKMGLRHAVVTSVDRDDLPDYGAGAFVGVIRSIRMLAPGVQGRGPHPRLPRPGDAAGEGRPRAARRLQPQCRDGPAALPASAPRLGLPALGAGSADGEGDGRCRRGHQVGADGRPRRGVRGDGRRVCDPARSRGPDPHRGPVPAPDREATCRSSATGTRTSSTRCARRPTSSASSRSRPGRWCAAPTTPTSRPAKWPNAARPNAPRRARDRRRPARPPGHREAGSGA